MTKAIFLLIASLCIYAIGCMLFADLSETQFDLRSLAYLWPWALQNRLRLSWSFYVSWIAVIAAWGFILYVIFKSNMKLYGEARFATLNEIKAGKLLGEQGVILGQISSRPGSRLIMAPGQAPVALAAPTRSGKGQSVVLPNLVNWPGSVVNLDVKKENYDLTSGFRMQAGQTVYFWNPAPKDGRTHGFNPLSLIDITSPTCIDDVQQLSYWLLGASSDSKSKFWENNSRQLFQAVALIVLCLEPREHRHLGTVQRYIMHTDGLAHLKAKLQESVTRQVALPHMATELVMRFIKLPDETREGVIGQYQSATELLNNPITIAALSRDDIDVRDLRKRRVSIYVCTTPDDRERMKPLLSMFFTYLLVHNMRQQVPPNDGNCDLLLLMDELPSIGKIDVLKNSVAYLAGYGIRLVSILQSPAQLRDNEMYGAEGARNYLDNHPFKVVFRPSPLTGLSDAKEISEALGTDTVNRKSRTVGASSPSVNTSEHGRPLMLPQEIMALEPDRCMIFTPDLKPIFAYKGVARNDPGMKARLGLACPEIPAIQIQSWLSVEFTENALNGVGSSAAATTYSSEGSKTPESSDQSFADSIADEIQEAGGDYITDADAENIALKIFERSGIKFV